MQTDRSTIDRTNKLNQHILSGRAVIYAKDNAIFGQINWFIFLALHHFSNANPMWYEFNLDWSMWIISLFSTFYICSDVVFFNLINPSFSSILILGWKMDCNWLEFSTFFFFFSLKNLIWHRKKLTLQFLLEAYNFCSKLIDSNANW